MANLSARRAPSFFSAEITFQNKIEKGVTEHGKPYMKSRNACIHLRSGKTIQRTVMAFGNRFISVEDCLVLGKRIDFTIQSDEGTLLILGRSGPPSDL